MAELLIVDDEAPFRQALRRTLERSGHRVREASSVEEARDALAAAPVELVLCDVNMPGGSGLELVRSVVDDSPETAIVMLTGIDDPGVADEALAIGAHGYLVTPPACATASWSWPRCSTTWARSAFPTRSC